MRTDIDINFGGVILMTAPPWEDFTDEVDGPDKPFTLARPSLDDGVVLQVSPMLYVSGVEPHPDGAMLLRAAVQKGQQLGLFNPFDEACHDGPLTWGACSYHATGPDADDFIRFWYLSDGRNLALVTFLCPRTTLDPEVLSQASRIVEGMRFAPVEDRRAA